MSALPIVDAQERRQALDPLQSFCVSAPAGSGKTELLIQRLLTVLARVEQPEQVLAITFTRKAAAEMRERVMQALADAQADTPCAGDHEKLTRSLAQAVLARDLDAGWRLAQSSSRLNIKTIDSFCSQLTRQMPVLSAFGGAAAVVDDAEELYREAVTDLYADASKNNAADDDLASLLLHFDNRAGQLQRLLVTMLGMRDQWFEYMAVGQYSEAASQHVLHLVRERVEGSLQAVRKRLLPHETTWRDLLDYARANLDLPPCDNLPNTAAQTLPEWRALHGILLTGGNAWRKSIDKRSGFPSDSAEQKDRKAQWKALLEQLRDDTELLELLQVIPTLPLMRESDDNWQQVIELTNVLPRLAAHLLLVFQRRGVVDFTQVSLSALSALGDDESPTDLALRLDYGISHILVDEFQDTAINQYRLIQRLTRGWAEHNAAHPDSPRTLMVVGDAMQSIYSFRNANVSLFLKARDEGFNGVMLQPLQLRCNFRSDETVVDWVNTVFAPAFPQHDDVLRSRVRYTPCTAVRAGGAEDAVQCHWYEGESAREQEVEAICEAIARGVDDAACESIAILGRSRAHLEPIMAALDARDIRYGAQDMASLSDSPVVQSLRTLCQALANRADSLAWMALLRAPWCGLLLADLLAIAQLRNELGKPSVWQTLNHPDLAARLSHDATQRLAGFCSAMQWALSRAQRLSLRVWVEQIWLRLQGPLTVRDEDERDDAEQVFQILEAMEQSGQGLDVYALDRRLDSIRISRDMPDSKIQFMTLHKSKGLEFDWVFIPRLASGGRADDRALLLWDDFAAGDGGFVLAADDRSERGEPTLYNYLSQQRKDKQTLERTRLLYVGATRAVKRLFLSASVKFEKNGEALAKPPGNALLSSVWSQVRDAGTLLHCDDLEDNSVLEASLRFARLASSHFTNIAHASAPVNNGETNSEETNQPTRTLNWRDRHLGTVIHAALEDLALADPLPEEVNENHLSRWRMSLQQFGFAGDALNKASEQVREAINTTLANEQGRWLLSAREQAYCEWAISGVDANGQLRDWVIDRSFVDQGQRWVIDYKSAQPLPGQPLDDFLAQEGAAYRAQLQGYKRAVGDEFPVRLALYFPRLGVLHELS